MSTPSDSRDDGPFVVNLAGPKFLEALQVGAISNPVVDNNGIKIHSIGEKSVQLQMTVKEHQTNTRGTGSLHGGITLTLIDLAACYALLTTLPPGKSYRVMSTNTDFTRAARLGDTLTVSGWAAQPKGSMPLCKVLIKNQKREVVAGGQVRLGVYDSRARYLRGHIQPAFERPAEKRVFDGRGLCGREFLEALQRREAPNPVIEGNGITIEQIEKARVSLRMVVEKHQLNTRSPKRLHGGVALTLVDAAACYALLETLPAGRSYGTLSANTDFLGYPKLGDVLTAEGKAYRIDGNTPLSRVMIHNQNGEEIVAGQVRLHTHDTEPS